MRFLLALLFVVATSANLAAATGDDEGWRTRGGRAARDDRAAVKIIDSGEIALRDIWRMKEEVLTLNYKHMVVYVNPLRKSVGEDPLPANKPSISDIKHYPLGNHFIAINAGEVVGFIRYWYKAGKAYVQTLGPVVNPEYKDSCIAQMLMLAVVQDALAKKGVTQVRVADFLSYDRPMEDFLASVGFEFPRGRYPQAPVERVIRKLSPPG